MSTRRTFADVVREFAPRAAEVLFEKARLASDIAKLSLGSSSRRSAYRAKERHLDRLAELLPGHRLLRRFKDFQHGRWVLRMGRRVIHWRMLDEAL